MSSVPTMLFISQNSWLVIPNILLLYFLLNSYIQNLPALDTKGKIPPFKPLENYLKTVSNAYTDENHQKVMGLTVYLTLT